MLDAALAELGEHGFAELSFERIASRAGVHKTTVYRRWPSRGDLLLDALRERSRETVPIPDTGSLRSDLVTVLTAIAANLGTSQVQAFLRATIAEGGSHPELERARTAYWRERFDMVGEIVRRAVARGELPPGADPDLVIESAVAPLYLRTLITGEEISDPFLARIADLVIAGVGAIPTR